MPSEIDSGINRFLNAQERIYDAALSEIRAGEKTGHWMWYIFPQLRGFGFSGTSRYYGLADAEEVMEYFKDATLRKRLLEVCEALLALDVNCADEIFGYPDNLKLKSCMTLFNEVIKDEPIFQLVINKFFNAEQDDLTLQLLYT